MGAFIEIHVEADNAIALTGEIQKRAEKRPEITTWIGKRAVAQIRSNVIHEFGGEFGGWPQLKPRTVKERERLGYGGAHPMLQRTHDLLNSVSFDATPDQAEAGPESRVFYSGFHDIPEGQDQRAYVHVPDIEITSWVEMIGAYFIEGTPLPDVAEAA